MGVSDTIPSTKLAFCADVTNVTNVTNLRFRADSRGLGGGPGPHEPPGSSCSPWARTGLVSDVSDLSDISDIAPKPLVLQCFGDVTRLGLEK